MQDPTYERRYCAFVDILGFKELIDKLDDGAIPLLSLRDLLSKVHNPPPTNAAALPTSDFRAQSISDAVALSAAPNPAGLGAIIHTVNQLAVELLKQGFFIRGAIVKDLLYHDDKTVFGRALLHAYALENSIVRYPRVMATREVVDDVRSIDEKTYKQLFRRSEDGPVFVHLLRAIEIAALPIELGTQSALHLRIDDAKFNGKLLPYAGIAGRLQRRFDEATDNPSHFEKVKWFGNYWNETIAGWSIAGLERVTGPGLDKSAAWGE
jgi:hypothetical protein